MRLCIVALCAALLCACGSKPRQPDWLVNADSAQERFERAYLSGDDRVANAEWKRLRDALASTGDPSHVARGELTRCAVQVAALDFRPCEGFEPLRADAAAAERAYADFLAGRAVHAKELPEAYRGKALKDIDDPLSRLVAAGVLLRTNRADPQTLEIAADTASQQGWRRAVLAWLGAQAMRAEQAGAVEEAARLRRRMGIAAQGK